MHCAWTCTHTYTHTHTNLYANFCLYIETTNIYKFQMRRKCTKGWCVLAVITMQCADVFWLVITVQCSDVFLSSLCSMLMCFGCHHCATSWFVESFEPSTKYFISSRMMEAVASSVHPPCHRQQDPLQVVHFYQATHCTSLNTAVSTSHSGV